MAKKAKSHRTGRPEFKVTDRLRSQVTELIACGMSQDDVARAIGCSTPTLVKHLKEELATGASRERAKVIGLLFKNARAGNVSAQKHLEGMTRTAVAAEAIERRGSAAALQETKVGKKQLQQEAADKVGGIFATPPAPKLVVSNG